MIRIGAHGPTATRGENHKVGQIEEQEALDLAADWADISQGLRKDLGNQLYSKWIKPIQLGSSLWPGLSSERVGTSGRGFSRRSTRRATPGTWTR